MAKRTSARVVFGGREMRRLFRAELHVACSACATGDEGSVTMGEIYVDKRACSSEGTVLDYDTTAGQGFVSTSEREDSCAVAAVRAREFSRPKSQSADSGETPDFPLMSSQTSTPTLQPARLAEEARE